MTTKSILTLELRQEQDVVAARQRARHVSALVGFDTQDQTRIATAVSEMARNAFRYAGGGRVEFALETGPAPAMLVRITDKGPGIADLDAVLGGRYESSTGMGIGIIGARRLMDVFEIRSQRGRGTEVLLGRHFTRRMPPPSPELLARAADELARQRAGDPLEEIQQQNRELMATLEEVRARREDLAQVNRELEETNRGVVALYAELDERADYLQRANEIKTRFLSNMTHEFRTPLNSITSLSRLLLQGLDGDLTSEQEKQIRFIQKSAESLGELVNDLLDLAKVEAGKVAVRPAEFRVEDLFGTLRGMLRPLLAPNSSVELVFDDAAELPPLRTDESKVSQILRNFISNALKYTETGEVRVSARAGAGNTVIFTVDDTGIGIAEADQERIFEEYGQVEGPLQRRVRGTGLGLPLARRLAGLLGGSIGVESQPGRGSRFFTVIPASYSGPAEVSFVPEVSRSLDATRLPVLVVEDNRESLFIYEKFVKGTRFQVLPARTLREARDWLRTVRPVAIVLDVLLETENSWGLLSELKSSELYRDIPVLVVTMVENEKRALALGASAFRIKPIERDWLLSKLGELTAARPQEKLLVIDDDEVSRYLLRGLLADTRFVLIESGSGREGLLLAREEQPQAIFLDLVLPGMDGFAILDALKADARTSEIPVFVHTSKHLTDLDRSRLRAATAIVPKESESREAAITTVRHALLQAGLGNAPEHVR